jgi:2-dehydro-3-deoxyphosphooctonate aldolase (KDO 8-P synthase)
MPFLVQNVTIGGPELFLIAGPCVIESEEHALFMAAAIAAICRPLGVPFIFKASYDKANRTSIASFRGPGLTEGLRILARVRDEVKVPVLTDVHEADQATAAGEVVDVLQIPAFLCRQTDLLIAAARTGRAVNVKKGQFAAPQDMRHAVAKIQDSGNPRVSLTERGASFGYHNLVVDMRSLAIMRQFAPVIFDATHSVQLPSQGAQSGGEPQFIPLLSRAAVAAGIDGIFMEVHDNPAAAKSDGANALPLTGLQPLLEQLLAIRRALSA